MRRQALGEAKHGPGPTCWERADPGFSLATQSLWSLTKKKTREGQALEEGLSEAVALLSSRGQGGDGPADPGCARHTGCIQYSWLPSRAAPNPSSPRASSEQLPRHLFPEVVGRVWALNPANKGGTESSCYMAAHQHVASDKSLRPCQITSSRWGPSPPPCSIAVRL